MFRLAAILLSALWLSGCFVADEIRQGDALIEQHSVGWREKKKSMQRDKKETETAEAEAQSLKARNAGPGVKDKLSDWWRETVDEESVSSNPSDKLVSCSIGGKVKFVRQSDCELRQGRAKDLKPRAESGAAASSKPKPGA